jgi:nucleoporin NUP82
MPQIKSFTPAWLSSPNPGHAHFAQLPKDASHALPLVNIKSKHDTKPGPRRTIAHRGTEVFVAVGKEIRWADLSYLKDAWKHGQEKKKYPDRRGDDSSPYDEDHAQGYRVSLQSVHSCVYKH